MDDARGTQLMKYRCSNSGGGRLAKTEQSGQASGRLGRENVSKTIGDINEET